MYFHIDLGHLVTCLPLWLSSCRADGIYHLVTGGCACGFTWSWLLWPLGDLESGKRGPCVSPVASCLDQPRGILETPPDVLAML